MNKSYLSTTFDQRVKCCDSLRLTCMVTNYLIFLNLGSLICKMDEILA